MGSKTDEALMLLYQQGEYAAFEELYLRHSGRVYGYLKKHLFEKGEAEDLMQHAFLKMHESRSRYQAQYPFLPWLFTIARNLMVDHLRRKKAIPVPPEGMEKLGGNVEVSEDTPSEDLKSLLAALSKPERDLIDLRFEEGLSFEEISIRLGVSQVSVRKRVSRALKKARKILTGSPERKGGL